MDLGGSQWILIVSKDGSQYMPVDHNVSLWIAIDWKCNHVQLSKTKCNQVQPNAAKWNIVQPSATKCN